MSQLKLYNTIYREKQDFNPIDENNVRMYVCGPTVYGDPHIGNARPAIVFDLMFRVLKKKYGQNNVTYVRNITDVDDKINNELRKQKISLKELTEGITEQFHKNLTSLNVQPPSFEPKVSDHMQEIIKLISKIIDNGFAYVRDDHVFFDISKYDKYGALSHQDINALRKGVRIDVLEEKDDPFDFVLWKPSDEETPGWESPWGRGRPGWHIECSAMSDKYLGSTFDIHGGGLDLVFPHHENEIAQSVCGNKAPFAKYWVHNGMIKINNEKMSKSLGNIITIKSLLDKWDGNVLRFAMLSSHYRSTLDWNDELLKNTSERLKRWSLSVQDAGEAEEADEEFFDSLYDDLNTPKAIAHLSLLHKKANKGDKLAKKKLLGGANFLGIKLEYKGEQKEIDIKLKEEIDRLISLRNEYKDNKDYDAADKIRDDLLKKGIKINDTATGTEWSQTN